jgi:hypothetical protein
MHTRVICGEGKPEVAVIQVEKTAELLGTAAYVLDRIMDIGYSQRCRGVGRQLHEPDRSFSRDGVLTKIRLGLDDRPQ